MGEPVISVVVPARNAAATLPRTLAALAESLLPREAVEVVVVDDCSTDDTALVAEHGGARVVRLTEQLGPAGARNAGIAAARSELIAFTDADCAPTPRWLPGMVAALAGADLVQGPVFPEPGVPVGPFDRTLHLAGASPRFETANLAVRRTLAEQVGGFAPFLPPAEGHFGEDAVFGWRARRLGARIGYCEAAVVHHAVFARGPAAYVRERWRLRHFPALVRELPELRAGMPARIFLSARTARFDAAVLGTAVAVRQRSVFPLALVVPYARRHLRGHRFASRGALRENAAYVAADAVGLVALVRGAIAARRLLL